MERITEKQLQAVIDRLNRTTNSPIASYTETDKGYKTNVGNYHLDYSYGRVAVVRMHNTGGGIESILPGGTTKRECYEQLHAYLKGIESTKERP